MANDQIRHKVAVVGVGNTSYGEMYRNRDVTRTAEDLGAFALGAALEDSGLDKDAIDGLAVVRIESYSRMAEMLGLRRLRWVNRYEVPGRFCGVSLQHAATAIATGQADTIALVYGNNGRSAGDRYGGEGGGYDSLYGMTSPGAYVALMYRNYMSRFAVPDGALYPLAANNRNNARRNPAAVMTDELTEEIYLGSRFIADPLRLYDYCLINDGAAAVILTSAERASDLRAHPVYIDAIQQTTDLGYYYTSTDYFSESVETLARHLYSDAGVGPADMDVLEIYDNFTPTILFSLEGFGFCPFGSSWEWIRDGRIELGGEMPINTSGGHTSESYMQGWNHFVELVRQLRHEAGDRQVLDCELGQYICVSPINTSLILSRG